MTVAYSKHLWTLYHDACETICLHSIVMMYLYIMYLYGLWPEIKSYYYYYYYYYYRANRDERQRGGVHSVDQNGRSDQLSANFELLSFDNVETNAIERDEVYATLRITLNDKANTPATLRVKVDTGAQGNVILKRNAVNYLVDFGLVFLVFLINKRMFITSNV